MNKQECIEAIKAGKRVRHTYFSEDEWVESLFKDSDEIYVYEDGVQHSKRDFWDMRKDDFNFDVIEIKKGE